jgi:hypothetical protein
MAYVVRPDLNLGEFQEREFSHWFTYQPAHHYPDGVDPAQWPHLVDVGNGENRFARVLKTVAHVVVDEDENGLVVEHWQIKQHHVFTRS